MHAQSQPLLWQYFIKAVKQEVKPALGCTEPISLAYAAAKAASFLDGQVIRVCAFVSPNLMKNGMGVTVPGTGMVGLPIAAALGAVGGDADAGLEVLKSASADAIALSKTMLAQGAITVDIKHPCDDVIYSEATVYTQTESATVIIAGSHTNIVKIVHNNHTVFDATTAQPHHESPVDCAADVPLPPSPPSLFINLLPKHL